MKTESAHSKQAWLETVYTPDGHRRLGMRVWRVMAMQLWHSRELIWRLMYRDFSAMYRQSMLGYVWAVIPPLVTVAIFAYLTSRRLLPIGDVSLPYPLFALWSISIWQLFATSITACTNSLVSAGSLVTKINFPKVTLIVAAAGQSLFEFLIRLVLVAIVIVWYGIIPPWQIIFVPLVLMPILLVAIGAGFLLSILNLVIRDIGNAIGIMLMFGMFAAPVLYPPPEHFPFFLVNILNPVSPVLMAAQDLLAYGKVQHLDLLLGSFLLSLLLFLVGWRIFSLVITRIAERA